MSISKGKKISLFLIFLILLVGCKHNNNEDNEAENSNIENITIEQVMETGIPVLIITTNNSTEISSKEEYVKASFNLISDDYEELKIDEISIKGRGNSSWSQPKKPYTIKLDKKNSVLGMAKSKKWVLIANYSDKSLLRNDFASFLGNEVYTNMNWNPSFKAVELILNGEYKGSYLIGEQIKIEEKRVNIQNVADTVLGKGEDLNADGIVDEKDGGFIFEVNTTRMDESYNYRTTRGIGMSLKDPDVEDFAENENKIEQYMADIIQTAEDVLYSEEWLDEENGYKKYIDTDSFIDWYFVNEITKNNDACWFSSVYFYYDPKNCKLYMGPDWDFDISCGNIDYNGCDNYEGFWIKNSGWHKRLFEDPEFTEKVKNRWNETKTSLNDAINTTIKEKSDYLEKSANLNFKRWNILGTYVWPNPTGYDTRTTYESEVEYLITWLNNRFLWLDAEINKL